MKKRTSVVLFALIIVSFLLPGCSNIKMVRTEELRIVQANVDSLRTEMVDLQNKIYQEQKAQGEIIRLIRADQQLRFGELGRQVSEMNTNLNESQNRLSKIDKNTAAVQKKIEASLSADSMAENARDNELRRLFDICMTDFNAGRFDLAINGLKDIVVQHPESPVAADAEYWIAECSYAKRAYSQAEKDYISYIRKYPEGSRLCVALYKLGLAYGKQNKHKSKKMVWKKALEQCPDAPEVQVIKNQMN